MAPPMPGKILVVEDHPDSREILIFQLQQIGYEVIGAATGEEGVEKALTEDPHLIVMDLMLPGIDGIEATARIKKNPRTAHIPVIALTAFAETYHKDRALETGVAEYLTKPASPQILAGVIKRFL